MGRPRKRIVSKPKGTPFYYYDWTIQGRRFRGSTEESEDEKLAEEIALEERRRIIGELRAGQEPKRRSITLNEALARAFQEHYQHLSWGKSVASIGRNLIRLLGKDKLLGDITDADLKSYVARRRGERWQHHETKTKGQRLPTAEQRLIRPRTVNHELKVLSKVMSLAREWGREVADVRPGRHAIKEPQSERIYLRQPQALELIDVIIPHAKRPVLFALYTGLRRNNAVQIRWEQLWLDGDRPFAEVLAKGQRRHVVWLPPEAVALLTALEPDPKRRKGAVFRFGNPQVGCDCRSCKDPNWRGRPIQSIRRSFKTAARRIGLPDLRQHDLRHTFASWVLQKGYGLRVLQDLLGHADIGTTRMYTHLEHGFLADAVGDAMAGFGTEFGRNKPKLRIAQKGKRS